MGREFAMKKTSRLSLVIALEIGASTYAALLYHDRWHMLLLTGLLCLVAGMIGTVVTRAKALATSYAILVLGLIALGIGLYFRVDLHYDERAAAALGIGVLGFLGGLAGIIIPRSRAVALAGLLVLGLVTLSIGPLFSGSMSSSSNTNLGAVLRWNDTDNWYKAYIDGASPIVQKKVNGATTILGSAPFTATAGTSYTVRFRVVGTTLYARVWQTMATEPTNWMITVTDTSFSFGYCGLRMQVAGGVTASYTSFLATVPGGTPTPSPSPGPSPGSTLAQDTFQRPNRALWGTASDGQTWGGDANTVSVFAILNNTGQISNNRNGIFNAVLGSTATDAEVLFSGSMSSFTDLSPA
jgi:hypothetical protein